MVTGLCRYGNDEGCIHKCYCESSCDSNLGECAYDRPCRMIRAPYGIRRQGQGCRIGKHFVTLLHFAYVC